MRQFVLVSIFATSILGACSPTSPEIKDYMSQNEKSSLEKFQIAKAKAEKLSPLNAFITLNENPIDSTSGRLSGMVIAVKDNIHVQNMPNSAGTAALEAYHPTENAPIVERLISAGAVILGKTNMHELAFGATSNNSHFGPVKNPYDTSLFPGGSSGGSAVAVSAGIVPAAIGTDTGASVRLPAALTGVIGFRPSLGRYPSDGITPISHTRDVAGPIAKTMSHITLLDSVMARLPEVTTPANISTLRLGVPAPFYDNLDPNIQLAMDEVLAKLEAVGITLVRFDIPEIMSLNDQVSFPIALYEGVKDLENYLERYTPEINFFDIAEGTTSPDVKGLFEGLSQDADGDGRPDGLIPKAVYDEVMTKHRPALIELYQKAFYENEIDALIFPTSIMPAGPIEGTVETISHNGEIVPTFQTLIRNTDPGSNAGLPGISLPLAITKNGLPVGVELDGLPGTDDKILAAALAIAPIFDDLPPPIQSDHK